MGRPWHPSLADQLEDVADKLLEAAYAVTAIAGQLREKPTGTSLDCVRFSYSPALRQSPSINFGGGTGDQIHGPRAILRGSPRRRVENPA